MLSISTYMWTISVSCPPEWVISVIFPNVWVMSVIVATCVGNADVY